MNVQFSQTVWFVTVAVTALMGTKHGRSSLHGHFAYLNPMMLFLCIHMYTYSKGGIRDHEITITMWCGAFFSQASYTWFQTQL